ncbi:hypothetical protein BDQ12DRAFT_682877 [Crucibulum laeve]|uniref:Uncharacterized protein n=1 Tax=Crucibulum laeve TaxID=68775 RepID=A0A5C3MCY8_9AGAR|nr:hypothetical protein BDQ12DRAFT_682877 [Crucibulum laeve]
MQFRTSFTVAFLSLVSICSVAALDIQYCAGSSSSGICRGYDQPTLGFSCHAIESVISNSVTQIINLGTTSSSPLRQISCTIFKSVLYT